MAEHIDGSTELMGGSVTRHTLNTTTPYQAVITKLIAGNGISITSTGVDEGTGDVTISIGTTTSGSGSGNGGTGTVTGIGSVTSVNMIVPTGFTMHGNPITTAGTLMLGIAPGYVLPLQSQIDTDTLNSVTSRGSVTSNIIRIGGIYASSDQLTFFGSELNYFYTNRLGSSGSQGFKIKGYGADLSFWRYNDSSGDVEIGNATNYGLKLYANNTAAITVYNTGDTAIGTGSYAAYKLDVFGSVRAGANGYYGNNGTITGGLIKFNGSNLVNIDPQGFGAVTNYNLTISGVAYATGRISTDSFVNSKGGSATPSTTFVSYGIGRPDTTNQVAYLAGLGGVYEGANWYNGLGLVFFVSSGTDISGGGSIIEKMRLKSTGDLLVTNLAGTGTRMVVADSSGILSTQTIPSGSSGTNIYTADGTLTGDRIVNLGGNKLIFNGQGLNGGVRIGTTTTAAISNAGYLLVGDPSNNGALSMSYDTLLFNGVNGFHFNIAKGLNETNPTQLFQIRNNGNVIIQTGGTFSDSGYKLDIQGTSRTTGVVLNESHTYTLGRQGIGRLSTPAAPTVTPSTTGGTLADGTYYYKIVALDILGNTSLPSTQTAAVVTGGGGLGSVTVTWTRVPGAYSYRIYRGTVSNTQNVYYSYSNSWTIAFETYLDTNATATSGTVPTLNTTFATVISTSESANYFAGPSGQLMNLLSGTEYGIIELGRRPAPVVIGTRGSSAIGLGGSGTGILLHSASGALGGAQYVLSNAIMLVVNGNAYSGTATNSVVISSSYGSVAANPSNEIYIHAGSNFRSIYINSTHNNIGIGNVTSLNTGTYTNTAVIGDSNINNLYFNGVVSTSAGSSIVLNAQGGGNTNATGGNITIAGGKGTGTGTPGDVIISTATPTTTGTTLQTLTNRVWIKGDTGSVGIGAAPNTTYILDVTGAARVSGQITGGSATLDGQATSGTSLGVKWFSISGSSGRYIYNVTTNSDLLAFNNGIFALQPNSINTFSIGALGITATGTGNVAILGGGTGAGSSNVSIGYTTSANLTTGSQNTAIGQGALYNVTTNSDNVAVGRYAGTSTGSNANANHSQSIFIGSGTGWASGGTALTNTTIIGYNLRTNLSNVFMLGRSDQTILVGEGTSVGSGAIFQIDSTTKGFLPPRMISTDRTNISTPATGLIVYQTDTIEGLYAKLSSAWVKFLTNGDVSTSAVASTVVARDASNYIYAASYVAVGNWYRNDTVQTGLYNSATTQYLSSKDNGYWDVSSTTTVSSIRFWTGSHLGTLRGYVLANSTNEIGFQDGAGAWLIRCASTSNTYISGTMTASADVIAYSDARLKTNIQTIDNALDKVISMRGVTYNRIDVQDKSEKVGVIAQEMQAVLPQVVSEDDRGNLGVSYGNLAGVFIEAFKEQQAQIEDLKRQIQYLVENR